ncbi:hypothetical protein [Chondromyces apiculatus]|uniref:Uncharacterized protein n=1 Tax=Chondromyces apiculatus DSM 436 TaxID=1192034 RepID=A0A017TC96_9BACT|nr:hypothetical protein [Chondromyces apiculatus]EYF06430.1 Hypothetical protein CAP_1960 [Chondromyces apiculatus DSM 436]
MSDAQIASVLLLEEHFEAGDERFVEEVLASRAAKRLKALGPRWAADARPGIRRALLRYIDDGCDRPFHRPLVKALFKHAERLGDDEAMGHFLVAFDRFLPAPKAPAKLWPGESDAPRFSRLTRSYLQRRATRYFRRLGRKDPARAARALRAAVVLYRDEHLETEDQFLRSWGLVYALYCGLIARYPAGAAICRSGSKLTLLGATLEQLQPAPMIPEAWQGVFEEIWPLVTGARSRIVRQFAIALLGRDYPAELQWLPMERVRVLLASPHEEVQTFGAELFGTISDPGNLPVQEWLALLRIENLDALPSICAAVERHVTPSRLTLDECVGLGCARLAPVAALGLRWARTKSVTTAEALESVLRLAGAPAPRVREEAAGWLFTLLQTSPHTRPLHVRDLIDARYADVRARGLALLEGDRRFGDDTGLWTALAESPHDDVRTFLLRHLSERRQMFSPEALRHVWATTLLGVSRGARDKRSALRLVSERIVARPAEAESLLPLLGVALRSVRPPERRAALAAVARAAFEAPGLRAAISRRLPELRLFSEELGE